MIINTGARTDTVQYYTPWLLRSFEDGYVLARNPLFPNKVTRYELDPAVVDCVVFCSKDYAPIPPAMLEALFVTQKYALSRITYHNSILIMQTYQNQCIPHSG